MATYDDVYSAAFSILTQEEGMSNAVACGEAHATAEWAVAQGKATDRKPLR